MLEGVDVCLRKQEDPRSGYTVWLRKPGARFVLKVFQSALTNQARDYALGVAQFLGVTLSLLDDPKEE